ncbi:DUF1127 domain-containing protein [Sagittula sp. NFXS13]|uniref:Uncharacterized protein YjiS (DUF1127 family) n=1 Tax=Sagittula marina TaxID=943940 RepID=A0A7W6DP70_9RHOB|nr:DUF1127 domain-containing protein [Sagittula marina]MBB3985151.1 uncharacterized protein YjiS (DUF1127 family) [Sagittula marina]
MAHMIARKDLSYLVSHAPLPAVSIVALRIAVLVAKWDVLRRTRNDLSGLDDHLLRDIGVTPDQARQEIRRPFWEG